MSSFAQITIDGVSHDMPIITGTKNEKAIDITQLRNKTGYITLDSGFSNTGSTQSNITFIDGEKGILKYRGIPIEELAEKSDFVETSYLLIYGKLPNTQELNDFRTQLTYHSLIHEDMLRFYDGFPPLAHPMAILSSMVCSLSTYYPDSLDPNDAQQVNSIIPRILSKLRTIAAYSFRKSIGRPVVYPKNQFSFCANFLYMMFAVPSEQYQIDTDLVKTLNMLFILHADHEQNCSTSTVRIVGSSDANLFASIASGICALWGPKHGGANQSVIEMLGHIHKSGGDASSVIKRAKDKNDKFRLSGFGHRVYKNIDPRATVIKSACDRILSKQDSNDPLLELAKRIEDAALNDQYFRDRNLYPNVDFYSGILYRAMGFPTEMFTVLFALGRLPGWTAHWLEMKKNNERLGRPRQIYQGVADQHYTPLSERK